MTAKEIWYSWNGQSLIPATATRYIDRNGHHHIPRFTIPFKHGGFGAGGEIIAYTLGETRERVECQSGCRYGCSCCKGRGYIWKVGVKK